LDSKQFYLECDDKCGLIVIDVDVVEDFDAKTEYYGYMTYFRPVFYTSQKGILNTIKSRFYCMWKILCGKEYTLYDLVLSKEKWEEYKKFINQY